MSLLRMLNSRKERPSLPHLIDLYNRSSAEITQERILTGLQRENVLLYLDDIIVFGSTFEEHIHTVFDRLCEAHLKVKPKKCFLCATNINYLRHVVTSKCIRTDPEKIAMV